MKLSLAVIALIGVNGVQLGHRHHHSHHHNKVSIPACNSATFPDCVKNAETAADLKLQGDMDKHPKDYFVPNFGVDHDIISTHANIKKAGGKLSFAQRQSIPACNSDKGCSTNTASPWKQKGDPIDDVHNYPAPTIVKTSGYDFTKPSALAQRQSIPACNSHSFPGCLDAKSSGHKDLKTAWVTDDAETPNLNESLTGARGLGLSLVQARSIPAFNSDKGRSTQTASPWKLNADPRIVDPEAYYKGLEDERIARKGNDLKELHRLEAVAAEAYADLKGEKIDGKKDGEKKEGAKKEEVKKENALIQSTIDNMDINQQPHMSQKKSDPIASSTGWLGPGHNPDKPVLPTAEEVVGYATNQPLDHDIVTTQNNIGNAEASVGRKWDLPKPAGLSALASDMRSDPPWNSHDGYETRDQQSDQSDLHKALNGLDVSYPEPHLSEDIKDSQKNLRDTEALLGHQYQAAAQIGSSLDVRSGVFSKNSVHVRKQKSQEMAQMRERMMSNWGTK